MRPPAQTGPKGPTLPGRLVRRAEWRYCRMGAVGGGTPPERMVCRRGGPPPETDGPSGSGYCPRLTLRAHRAADTVVGTPIGPAPRPPQGSVQGEQLRRGHGLPKVFGNGPPRTATRGRQHPRNTFASWGRR